MDIQKNAGLVQSDEPARPGTSSDAAGEVTKKQRRASGEVRIEAGAAGKGLSSKRDDRIDRLAQILSPVGLLVIWELAAMSGALDLRFFPAPSQIFSVMITITMTGELIGHIAISLQRLVFGTLIGGIPALVIGILMGLYRPIRLAVDPIISATYPIPKSAILPLALLIFGLGEASKVAMVSIGVFYPLAMNTRAGVSQIQSIYFDVGTNFGASRWQMFRTVAFPGALPSIFTGLQLGIGLGLILIAIAEMVGANSGIGWMIWNAWQVFLVERMYVGLMVIGILGVIVNQLLRELERWMLPWRRI